MKKITIILLVCCLGATAFAQTTTWKAKRITASHQNESNSWMDFRKDIELTSVPNKAIVKIACDSKYWLWVNGVLAVFEGQLKRGPNPNDTYYDEVDIAPFLLKGENSIAVLVWYFGKDGFSHNSSGAAGLAFECDAINLISDGSWTGKLDKGFDVTGRPSPNSRLPESNVKFNAEFENFEWIKPKYLVIIRDSNTLIKL
jgi:alpha-L-rhamnosidase